MRGPLYSYARVFNNMRTGSRQLGAPVHHPSEYSKRINYLSASIFNTVKRPTSGHNRRVVTMMQRRPYEDRKEIVEYYPAHDQTHALMTHLRHYGLFQNEFEDYKDEMEQLRTIRGRPKKVYRFGEHWEARKKTLKKK